MFSGAPGCFGESSFRDAVAIFFGGADPFDPNAPDVVRVTFTKIPGGYRGAVQYTPPSGDPWPAQEKTGASCASLFDDLSLTASLRVPDHPPKIAPAPPPPDPPPKPPDRAVAKPPESFVPPPTPRPDFRTRTTPLPPESKPMDLTIALSASALMTAGFTADVGPAIQIGAEARYQDWFSLGLEVRGVLPSRIYARGVLDKTNPYSSERYLDASQVTGLLVPCFRFKVYFAACAVGQVGTIITQSPVDSHILGSFALGPRLALELPLGERFAAFAFGEALFATPSDRVGLRPGRAERRAGAQRRMDAIGGVGVLRGGAVGEVPVKRGVLMRSVWFSIFVMGLVVVAAFSAGCGRDSNAFYDRGETGSTTSTGEGGSGGDIFTTGTGGAGGDAVCAGSCVAGKPAWFDGLSLFWIGAPEEAPPCSDIGLSEGSVGYADPIAPTTCPSCSCSPATCELPEVMHASAAKCPAVGAPAIPFDAPAGWEGTCSAENAIAGGLQCSGVPCVQSLTISAPGVAPCQPVADGDPVIPLPAWGKVASECVIWPISGDGCATGEACTPPHPDGYAVCVYRHGDHSNDPGFACPADYPRSLVVYASYEDTRSCEPCTCGDPEGAACTALVSAFKDGSCGGMLGSVTVSTAVNDACVDLPSGTALGSKTASLVLDQPGTCTPGGGSPAGTFEPADPMTLCCEPDPDPAH